MNDKPSNDPTEETTAREVREQASQEMSAAVRAFYDADPRRAGSAERDFGLRWRSATGATYRAAWIAETGELYAVRHSGDDAEAQVTVLARLGSQMLDRALAGWRRIVDTNLPGSYEWLVERAGGAWRSAAPAF